MEDAYHVNIQELGTQTQIHVSLHANKISIGMPI